MEIIQSILTKSPCYATGRKIAVRGLMLHSSEFPEPKAEVHIKNLNRINEERFCVHAFIDGETGKVYQTLPWEHRGWHAGAGTQGSANDTHIGIDICEPASLEYKGISLNFTCSDVEAARESATLTYGSAVELFAFLCKEYNLDPLEEGVIISHSEGVQNKIAYNGGDPEHLWRGLDLPYTMDSFRYDVKKVMNFEEFLEQEEEPEPEPEIEQSTQWRVKVTADALYVRSGPDKKYQPNGIIRNKGIYTIVAKEGNWGKLSPNEKFVGWILLDFTKEL